MSHRRNPVFNPGRQLQRQAQREYSRREAVIRTAWTELDKRCDNLTKGQPKRVSAFIKAVLELRRKRGGQLQVQYLGPTALGKCGYQSESSDKRAKPKALGDGLLWRVHHGGGRLGRANGGGKNSRGRWKGDADGVAPGPELTGWTEADYEQWQKGPPASPPAGPIEEADEAQCEQRTAAAQWAAAQLANGP